MDVQQKLKNIIDTISSKEGFNSLSTTVKAADLVETLQSNGPFTVFAPSDEAFSKLKSETMETLINPENKNKLTGILTYHIVPEKIMVVDIASMSELHTVNGESLKISVEGYSIKLDEARIIKNDIECSNGVIHVIDSILVPKH